MPPKIEQLSTELAGVPVILDQKVVGYFLFKLSATIDRRKVAPAIVDLHPYLSNAGFRASYEFAARGTLKVRGEDVQALTRRVAELANEALGEASVVGVQVEQFNFARNNEVRRKISTVVFTPVAG